MLIKTSKEEASLGCRGTLLGVHLFSDQMEGYLDELVWGFLKKGMKIYPHKHSQKEAYVFIRGNGMMQVDGRSFSVKERDVVFIPSNAMHTAWNNDDEDLEFILVRTRDLKHIIKRLVKFLSKATSRT